MKPKKLKSLIKKTRSRLSWPVIEIRKGDTLEIVSDHHGCSHTIISPSEPGQAGDVRDIEFLHELAHATLCETVHPMFSTHYFARDTPADSVRVVAPASRAANDWFADAWLMRVAPEEEKAEIQEHLNLVIDRLRDDPTGSPEMIYGAGLIIAQGIKYLNAPLQCGGVLMQIVNAFISVPAEKPTVDRLETLINKLLTPLYPQRVKRVFDDELECWLVLEQ